MYIRLITTYLNVISCIILYLNGSTSSYSNEFSKFLDPVEQFQYENDDVNVNKRFQKSVFNVPVRTEPTVAPCPPGSQRIESSDGPCIPIGPTIKFGEAFLLQSFNAFNNRRKISSSTTENPIITSSRPTYPHGKRRRTTTTFRPKWESSTVYTTTTRPTTVKYEEGPTYIINNNEQIFRQLEPKPSISEDDTTTLGQVRFSSSGSGIIALTYWWWRISVIAMFWLSFAR